MLLSLPSIVVWDPGFSAGALGSFPSVFCFEDHVNPKDTFFPYRERGANGLLSSA